MPPNGAATLSGLCYTDGTACSDGPNACSDAHPCLMSGSCPDDAPYSCQLGSAMKSKEFTVTANISFNGLPAPDAATLKLGTQAFQTLCETVAASVSTAAVAVPPPTVTVALTPGTALGKLAWTMEVAVVAATASNAATIATGFTTWLNSSAAAAASAGATLADPLRGPGSSPLQLPSGVTATLVGAPLVTAPAVPPPPVTWGQLVAQAGDGSTGVITIADNLLALPGQQLVLGAGRALTLIGACGAGGVAPCVIDGGGATNGFYLSVNSQLTLSNLVLRNGSCAKGVCATDTSGGGGMVWAGGGSTLTLVNVTLANNSAAASGGAVYSLGTVVATNAVFSGNRAGALGGALMIAESASGVLSTRKAAFVGQPPRLVVSNASFLANAAGLHGGAVACDEGGVSVFTSVTAVGNAAAGAGGFVYSGALVNVTACTLIGNAASAGGGALFGNAAVQVQAGTVMQGNAAPQGDGGALYLNSTTASITLSGSTLVNNSAFAVGGAVYSRTAAASFTSVVFATNVAHGPFAGCGGLAVITENSGRVKGPALRSAAGCVQRGGRSRDARTRTQVRAADERELQRERRRERLHRAARRGPGRPGVPVRLQPPSPACRESARHWPSAP